MALSKILTRYQKHCETSENHKDKQLQTRYYKAGFKPLFDSIEKIFTNTPNYKLKSVSQDHGEIAITTNKTVPLFIVITIVNTRPFETAVDIHISTDSFLVTGTFPVLRQEVLDIYKKVGEFHPFIGAGRNANI